MATVETIGKVRNAFLVKGKSIKRIARELRLARNTVRGIVRGEETERRYLRADHPLPQLGGFAAALDEMLSANAGKAKRERLTFQRMYMYEELRLFGYGGGYDAVRRMAGPGRNGITNAQPKPTCRSRLRRGNQVGNRLRVPASSSTSTI